MSHTISNGFEIRINTDGIKKVARSLSKFLDGYSKLQAKKNKSRKRRQFSKKTKLAVLKAQNFKCKMCKTKLDEVDFDHIDGNRANNLLSNCQAMCPNCHRKKTRKRKSY